MKTILSILINSVSIAFLNLMLTFTSILVLLSEGIIALGNNDFTYLQQSEKEIKQLKWIFWDFSGLHLIWLKIIPQKEKVSPNPPSFFLWLLSLYLVVFALASQRFEHSKDRLGNELNLMVAQLGAKTFKTTIERFPEFQKKKRPVEPFLLNPIQVVFSFFDTEVDPEVLEGTKSILVSSKMQLEGIDLSGVNLSGANLSGASLGEVNLSKANLLGTNLSDADLIRADLSEANLNGANLSGAQLVGANLSKANLSGTNLREANLIGAQLFRADLSESELRGVNLIGAKLLQANLSGAILLQADLVGTKLLGARYSDKTKFPEKFRPKSHNMIPIQ